MDAFYASVEQRDNPDLRGKAIAVGGSGRRGVITTASYEARKYGIGSAMPGFKAKALYKDIIFVKPRFDAYKEVSIQVRNIFKQYTDLIEPLSLDEAFLDVTENKIDEAIATEIAKKIKADVLEVTELTCSAGVSYCKFLAKIASDMNKPDGLTVIKPHQAEAFLEKLPVKKFFGIGKVTAQKMNTMGINTGADLKALSKYDIVQNFGKMGNYYYDIVRGIDDRPVKTNRIRKSLAVERTLEFDVSNFEEAEPILEKIIDEFYARLERANNFGRTITLKLKSNEFKLITRSQSFTNYILKKDEIKRTAQKLLKENLDEAAPIRLIGLSASNLQQEQGYGDSGQILLDF